MKENIATAGTIVLAVCALFITGLVATREFSGPPAPEPREPRPIRNWERLAATGHVLGPREAPVTIIEFSDFQCPFCKRVQPALDRIQLNFSGQVRIVYRHLPLTSIHPYAFAAALASECAAAQGRFESYHDILFAHQDSLGGISFDKLADLAGVPDIDAFRECTRDERFRNRVERDRAAAWDAGLRSTPSIIVEGMLLPGTPSFSDLKHWTRLALAHSD